MVVKQKNLIEKKIVVIGLGYVGFPIFAQLNRVGYDVVGFDNSETKVGQLKEKYEEVNCENISSETSVLNDRDVFVVCVPTPVDETKKVDLSALKNVGSLIGKNLKKGAIIILESTVFPGTTNQILAPIISEVSGLIVEKDFFMGYSPERLSPGTDMDDITKISKVISANNSLILNEVKKLYSTFMQAELFEAKSIEVAEASKLFENVQRDVNIALYNEFGQLCDKLNLDLKDVVFAAKTKWNFHEYKRGLVGGHCIGVDPYYLLEIASEVGFSLPLVKAARDTNDSYHFYVIERIKKFAKETDNSILIFGGTYKENVPDFRNSGSIRLAKALIVLGYQVTIIDPFFNTDVICDIGDLHVLNKAESSHFLDKDLLIYAVDHDHFKEYQGEFENFLKNKRILSLCSIQFSIPVDEVL